jgi:hypothetical protein
MVARGLRIVKDDLVFGATADGDGPGPQGKGVACIRTLLNVEIPDRL